MYVQIRAGPSMFNGRAGFGLPMDMESVTSGHLEADARAIIISTPNNRNAFLNRNQTIQVDVHLRFWSFSSFDALNHYENQKPHSRTAITV